MRITRRVEKINLKHVNAESVAKFRLIETNDMNKTDTKDPRVISSLGKLNKTLRYRLLGEEYHRKKEREKRPGTMVMTIVAHQFLCKVHGWYRSANTFDAQRFFTCKSRYVELVKAA